MIAVVGEEGGRHEMGVTGEGHLGVTGSPSSCSSSRAEAKLSRASAEAGDMSGE